jgi:hypothetical protein
MTTDFKRLIRDFGEADPNTLEDLWLILARNVEDSLIEAGATPGEDYTMLDLYKLAQPFVLDLFRKPDNDITFTYKWPHD